MLHWLKKQGSKVSHGQADFTYSSYEAFCSLLEVRVSEIFMVSFAFCQLFMIQMKWKRNCNGLSYWVFLQASNILFDGVQFLTPRELQIYTREYYSIPQPCVSLPGSSAGKTASTSISAQHQAHLIRDGSRDQHILQVLP